MTYLKNENKLLLLSYFTTIMFLMWFGKSATKKPDPLRQYLCSGNIKNSLCIAAKKLTNRKIEIDKKTNRRNGYEIIGQTNKQKDRRVKKHQSNLKKYRMSGPEIWYFLERSLVIRQTMVLILDGSYEYDLHLWSKSGILIS